VVDIGPAQAHDVGLLVEETGIRARPAGFSRPPPGPTSSPT